MQGTKLRHEEHEGREGTRTKAMTLFCEDHDRCRRSSSRTRRTCFTWLQDEIIRRTEYWRLFLGLAILVLVLLFPRGVVGSIGRRRT